MHVLRSQNRKNENDKKRKRKRKRRDKSKRSLLIEHQVVFRFEVAVELDDVGVIQPCKQLRFALNIESWKEREHSVVVSPFDPRGPYHHNGQVLFGDLLRPETLNRHNFACHFCECQPPLRTTRSKNVPELRLRPLCTVPKPPLPIVFPICCEESQMRWK